MVGVNERKYFSGLNLQLDTVSRLVTKRQMDAAISHYIEAGATVKALEAAVNARQFRKALQVSHLHLQSTTLQYTSYAPTKLAIDSRFQTKPNIIDSSFDICQLHSLHI